MIAAAEQKEIKVLYGEPFQDWMVDVGLMERKTEVSEINLARRINPDYSVMKKILIEMLGNKWGYIVSREELARLLYGGVIDQSTINCVRCNLHYYKTSGRLPSDFFSDNRGVGRGVKSIFKCFPQELDLLNTLWEKKKTDYKDIAMSMYSFVDLGTVTCARITTNQLSRRLKINSDKVGINKIKSGSKVEVELVW